MKKPFDFNFYGMPRSGSTFIIQVLFRLFGGRGPITATFNDLFVTSHELEKRLEPKIVTYRDFRDIALSYWRIKHGCYSDTGELVNTPNEENISNYTDKVMNQIRYLNAVWNYCHNNNLHVLYLRYENFYNNYDWLYDQLQEFFQITINSDVRDDITKKFNLKVNKKVSDNYGKEFNDWDHYTRLHHRHIYKGTPGLWKDIIPIEYHELMNIRLKESLEEWGYKV